MDGRFGLWKETGYLNDLINDAYQQDPTSGMGETVGRAILEGDYPYKDASVFAAAVRWGVPVTVHVGIGYDIIHEHPNCNGAATGQLSYNDFLRLVGEVQDLEDGVVMNFGSAVMAPEVFLKALSMARNLARQQGSGIRNFCSLVCDVRDLSGDLSQRTSQDFSRLLLPPLENHVGQGRSGRRGKLLCPGLTRRDHPGVMDGHRRGRISGRDRLTKRKILALAELSGRIAAAEEAGQDDRPLPRLLRSDASRSYQISPGRQADGGYLGGHLISRQIRGQRTG